jgi:hypothetical protein
MTDGGIESYGSTATFALSVEANAKGPLARRGATKT